MWRFYRFRTVDGLVLGELPVVPFSWSRQVRDGSMNAPSKTISETASSIQFPVAALEEAGVIDRSKPDWELRLHDALMPLRTGIVACWDGTPIVMGVIGSPRDDADPVGVTVAGVTTILAKRFIIPESFTGKSRFRFTGTLGTIAKKVVQQALTKPGGSLPILFPADEAGSNERIYQAYDVANLSAAHLVELISNVEGGPDIDFRPVWVDSQHVAWRMVTGTKLSPFIAQSRVPLFEVGSTDVEGFTSKTSAEYVAQRVYGVGDGQDEGTRMGKVEAVDDMGGFPLMEKVVTDSSAWTTNDLLQAGIRPELSVRPLRQVTVTVRADGSVPLGSFWPGDVVKVRVHDQPTWPDGTYEMRIQSMSGSDGKSVSLALDPVEG